MTAGVVIPEVLRAGRLDRRDMQLRRAMVATADPALIRMIALTAVDAAKAAGATYADVRLTRVVEHTVGLAPKLFEAVPTVPTAQESEYHGIGVRAFVDGMWGFASSPYWTPGEGARLAQQATAQARENARATATHRELAATPVVTGTWSTPHEVDPFTISLEEKLAVVADAYTGIPERVIEKDNSQIGRFGYASPITCRRVDTTLATTEGTFITQQYYTTLAQIIAQAGMDGWVERDGQLMYRTRGGRGLSILPDHVQGSGWEAVRTLPAIVTRIADDAYNGMNGPTTVAPAKVANGGRYTVVADAVSMGVLLGFAVRAMDPDRIIGDGSNSGGSSWLGNDLAALPGHFEIGSPLLSVTINRGLRNGPTRTQWDDEGVVATPIPLIHQGVLQDFPTTRETAGLLAPTYQRLGRPVRSNGCAMASSAFEQQAVGIPDVVMTPATEDVTWSQLVESVSQGYALVGLNPNLVETDMQLRQLVIRQANLNEIVNGRMGASVVGVSLLIDAAELWKNLTAIGGTSSLNRWEGAQSDIQVIGYTKGEPVQSFSLGIQAVPGLFTNIPMTNGQL